MICVHRRGGHGFAPENCGDTWLSPIMPLITFALAGGGAGSRSIPKSRCRLAGRPVRTPRMVAVLRLIWRSGRGSSNR
jgi:hypothetical protein